MLPSKYIQNQSIHTLQSNYKKPISNNRISPEFHYVPQVNIKNHKTANLKKIYKHLLGWQEIVSFENSYCNMLTNLCANLQRYQKQQKKKQKNLQNKIIKYKLWDRSNSVFDQEQQKNNIKIQQIGLDEHYRSLKLANQKSQELIQFGKKNKKDKKLKNISTTKQNNKKQFIQLGLRNYKIFEDDGFVRARNIRQKHNNGQFEAKQQRKALKQVEEQSIYNCRTSKRRQISDKKTSKQRYRRIWCNRQNQSRQYILKCKKQNAENEFEDDKLFRFR